jgi:D-3-phosphoglycerate dehydrogenase
MQQGRPMQLHVAILDNLHPQIRQLVATIAPAEWELSFLASLEAEQRNAALAEADVVFIIGASIDAALLGKAPRLRFIQKLGAGLDKIDLQACERRGVAVARLNAGNAIPVAEHMLMLMLAALRRLSYFDRRTRQGDWLKEEGRGVQRQLAGKRVGLVGFGAIGREVARRLQGFDVDLVYYDPFPVTAELEFKVTRCELEDLLRTSDVISLHLPLTPETRNLLSREHLALLKPGATVINCARGGLIDETALAEALESGALHAAGLDTFAIEPPGASPLFDRDDVVVTPHLAGATYDNFETVFRRGMENVGLFLAGAPLSPAEIVVQPPAA